MGITLGNMPIDNTSKIPIDSIPPDPSGGGSVGTQLGNDGANTGDLTKSTNLATDTSAKPTAIESTTSGADNGNQTTGATTSTGTGGAGDTNLTSDGASPPPGQIPLNEGENTRAATVQTSITKT
jgi:hypothetical protein